LEYLLENRSLTLTVDETAALLDISADAVYDAVKRGEIRAVRIGRQIRVALIPLLASLGVDADTRSHRDGR
jgi:putative molybdopterin biosynthesis protein